MNKIKPAPHPTLSFLAKYFEIDIGDARGVQRYQFTNISKIFKYKDMLIKLYNPSYSNIYRN